MNYYANDPREIKAKFDGKCKETGRKIARGQSCIYYPSDKTIYHLNSKQAAMFRAWADDISQGANY